LLAARVLGGEFLNFRAVGFFSRVAGHAGFCVWYCRVRGLVGVFVAKSAANFRPALLCDVLPVIERYWLARSFRLARRLQQQKGCDRRCCDRERCEFRSSFHLFSKRPVPKRLALQIGIRPPAPKRM
jgi:hypothetical protein